MQVIEQGPYKLEITEGALTVADRHTGEGVAGVAPPVRGVLKCVVCVALNLPLQNAFPSYPQHLRVYATHKRARHAPEPSVTHAA